MGHAHAGSLKDILRMADSMNTFAYISLRQRPRWRWKRKRVRSLLMTHIGKNDLEVQNNDNTSKNHQ